MDQNWRLAVVAGPRGAAQEAALRRLGAGAPRPLRAYESWRAPGDSTIVAELEQDFEHGFRTLHTLLRLGYRVVLVSSYDVSELRELDEIVYLEVGPVRPIPVGPPDYNELDLEVIRVPEYPRGQSGRGLAETRTASIVVADATGRAAGGALPPALPYLVRVGIGAPRPESILPRDDPGFPAELLPVEDGWWLRAILSRGRDTVAEGALFLPRTGEGFSCACAPGDRHSCTQGDRSFWLTLAVVAPARPGTQQLQLALLHRATTVQIFEITLAFGAAGPLPAARAIYTLTTDYAGLGDRFDRRDVSIQEHDRDGRHYLMVNGAEGTRVGAELADQQAGDAARMLRRRLFERHLRDLGGGRLATRYDRSFGKSRNDYLDDLWELARVGATVHTTLFPDATDRDAMRQALAHGDGPGRIQVALAEGSRAVVPWQLVYGLPIADRAAVCPSVDEFGPGSSGDAIPDRCPHADRHDQRNGVLCPFGFWGLAHVLEVPPSSRRMTLAEATGDSPPPTVVVAWNNTLPGADWETQRAVLAGLDRDCVVTTGTRALREAVRNGADLLYLYCHGREVAGAGGSSAGVALDFGNDDVLLPGDVSVWADVSPRIRWSRRRPLVVLNGCFTGARLPETLADFASAFVQSTGAAGVLATEVVMESGLAAHAMSAFVTAWSEGHGAGVGDAMRRVRWQLLARGNVMGLAYSPYCDADLRLP